jgi:hypothetical protein
MRSYVLFVNSLFLATIAALLASFETTKLDVIGFVFASTFLAYSFIRASEVLPQQKKIWWMLNTVSSVAAVILTLAFSKDQWILISFNVLIVLAYRGIGNFSLRKRIYLKPFSIALCWMINTSLIPFDQNPFFIPNDHSVGPQAINILVLTYCLSLLYDLKDVARERGSLLTLASISGIKKVFHLNETLLIILTGFGIYAYYYLQHGIAIFAATLYVLIIQFLWNRWKEPRTTFLIDGAYIIYIIAFLLCKNLV